MGFRFRRMGNRARLRITDGQDCPFYVRRSTLVSFGEIFRRRFRQLCDACPFDGSAYTSNHCPERENLIVELKVQQVWCEARRPSGSHRKRPIDLQQWNLARDLHKHGDKTVALAVHKWPDTHRAGRRRVSEMSESFHFRPLHSALEPRISSAIANLATAAATLPRQGSSSSLIGGRPHA